MEVNTIMIVEQVRSGVVCKTTLIGSKDAAWRSISTTAISSGNYTGAIFFGTWRLFVNPFDY